MSSVSFVRVKAYGRELFLKDIYDWLMIGMQPAQCEIRSDIVSEGSDC